MKLYGITGLYLIKVNILHKLFLFVFLCCVWALIRGKGLQGWECFAREMMSYQPCKCNSWKLPRNKCHFWSHKKAAGLANSCVISWFLYFKIIYFCGSHFWWELYSVSKDLCDTLTRSVEGFALIPCYSLLLWLNYCICWICIWKNSFCTFPRPNLCLGQGSLGYWCKQISCMEQKAFPGVLRSPWFPSFRALKDNFPLALLNKVLYVPFSECKYCFFSKCHMKLRSVPLGTFKPSSALTHTNKITLQSWF